MVTLLIILALISLDGYFSLAEMALVSVTKGELTEDSLNDDPRALKALALLKNPGEFLSTIQVGSTLLELIQGIYGGNMAAQGIKWMLVHYGVDNNLSDIIALTLGIGIITFVSIVFGELVPKSIALQVPLRTALSVAIPLRWFARLAFPFIKILTYTTRKILALLNIKGGNRRVISEKELRGMLGAAYEKHSPVRPIPPPENAHRKKLKKSFLIVQRIHIRFDNKSDEHFPCKIVQIKGKWVPLSFK